MPKTQFEGRTFDVNLGVPEHLKGIHLPASHLWLATKHRATAYDLKQDALENSRSKHTDERLIAQSAQIAELQAAINVNPTPGPVPVPVPVPPGPTPTPPAPVTGVEFAFPQGPMDQGPEGECVGFGGGGYAGTEPYPKQLIDPHTETESATTELLYVAAQIIDGTIQAGQDPDEQAGASVSAGMQALMNAGLIVSSHALTTIEEILAAL